MATIKTGTELMTFTSTAKKNFFTVTCSDASWTVRSNRGWITVKKLGSSAVEVAVTANTGSEREGGVIVTSGTDTARVKIVQEGETVSYDASDKIIFCRQEPNMCAAACMCMCVKQPIATVKQDLGKYYEGCYWSIIASHYNYVLDNTDSDGRPIAINVSESSGLNKVRAAMEEDGEFYPVIAQIHDKIPNELSQHWVVITGYNGSADGSNISASDFTCYDPSKEEWENPIPLSEATRYVKIYRYSRIREVS